MRRRTPRSTRTETLLPYTTLFRSERCRWRETQLGGLRKSSDPIEQGFVPKLEPEGKTAFRHGEIRNIGKMPSQRIGKRQPARGVDAVRFSDMPTQLARSDEIGDGFLRSEEHTSELQSLMRISYAVFCLKKKNKTNTVTELLM